MRADAGPLAIFSEGARRLIRGPLPLVALWLPSAVLTYATGEAPSFYYLDLVTDSGGIDVRRAIGTALWLVLSSFLWGGILTRYAHPRMTGLSAFIAGGRSFGGRLLRLMLLSVAVSLIFHVGTRPPQEPEDDLMAEFHVADWAPLVVSQVLMLWIQLAGVRTIVEDRRSVLFSLTAALRLMAARPFSAIGIYAFAWFILIVGLSSAFLFLATLWQGSGWPELLFSQIMTAAIVWFDLQTAASLVALYRSEMIRLHPEHGPAEASSGLSRLNALTAKE